MTEENLKLGNRKMEVINELRLFKKILETDNYNDLRYGDAKLTVSRGNDLYKVLMGYLNEKIAVLEEDFANFDTPEPDPEPEEEAESEHINSMGHTEGIG